MILVAIWITMASRGIKPHGRRLRFLIVSSFALDSVCLLSIEGLVVGGLMF